MDEGFVAGTTRALFCVLPLTASGVCFRLACAGRGPPHRLPTGRLVEAMNAVDVAVPYLICFTLLGAGVSLAFDLFEIRKFLTGERSPFSEWRHAGRLLFRSRLK
ncbi:hypothetical protein HX747_19305 [Streptomyces sp. L06]|nr:hypothetical protein [Streptomyces sp. L06]